jgi:hypothetical protein
MKIQKIEKPQVQSSQHISSMTKVEFSMGRENLKVEACKEVEILEV